VNILITNFHDSRRNILVVTKKLLASQLKRLADLKGEYYNEVFSLQDSELGDYEYLPYYLSEQDEEHILKIL